MEKQTCEVYALSTRPAWTKEPRIIEISDLMDIVGNIYMTFAVADDDYHVVLMESKMMSKLFSKIRTGELVYILNNGLRVYEGGPEKWYSNILSESVD